jgi:hypothetical protein
MSKPQRVKHVFGKPPSFTRKGEGSGDDDPDDAADHYSINNNTGSQPDSDTSKCRSYSITLGQFLQNLLPTFLPSAGLILKSLMGITVSLYILNQKHLLPKPISRIVSKSLFWPTLPITVVRRLGSWETVIDSAVVMGGAPFGFANIPEKLYEQYGVRSIVM